MIDPTKSLKQRIFETISAFDIEVSYNESLDNSFPRVVYFLVSNYSRRLSNRRVVKHISYQVSLYDVEPHDVEMSSLLTSIQDKLEENGLFTTDWQEVSTVEEDTEETIYHYFLEVSV